MRSLCKDIVTALFMGMILPGVLVNGAVLTLEQEAAVTEIRIQKAGVPVQVRRGQTVTQMDLEEYIIGVVLAEMPASFGPEALKAQSVAARTYAAKAAVTGGKHGDGSVCADSACCQGYQDRSVYLESGGREEPLQKISAAVADTAGTVLIYEEDLIEATYFSCSNGKTEDAVAVWGADVPYLRSVSSLGEEEASVYRQTVTFTPEEFQLALGTTLLGAPETWFSMTTYTSGGGVAAMTIGGKAYSGTELRSALGLRSTAFSLSVRGNKISITTEGYGHRVGMSQYGADAMAAAGSTWQQILAHYYPGTELAWLGIDESGEMAYSTKKIQLPVAF